MKQERPTTPEIKSEPNNTSNAVVPYLSGN